MSDPDADASRYKYVHGEITRLRREIELKRRNLSRLNHTAAQPTYQPKTERVRWPQSRLVISLANSFEKSDSTDESVTNDYIIDHENRTLMTPRAMKRHQAKVQQMRAENARKRAILRAEWDAQEWTEFKNWNLAETEACDRVLIDGNAYGVNHDGTRLLPIDGSKRKEGEIQMIAEPTEENNVVIPRDATDLMEETTVVSSYTVDPKILFVRSGQVKFSIDRPDGEMIIDLSSATLDNLQITVLLKKL
ncbi:hypothetical protein OY671_003456 [Metschnikowia pulcherrima]|nr:hypothetical protein OY671_003456 [Metschnikowia pulcherrima]